MGHWQSYPGMFCLTLLCASILLVAAAATAFAESQKSTLKRISGLQYSASRPKAVAYHPQQCVANDYMVSWVQLGALQQEVLVVLGDP